jgi:hypothetical protein
MCNKRNNNRVSAIKQKNDDESMAHGNNVEEEGGDMAWLQ